MLASIATVAFEGVEARRVSVEVQLVGRDGETIFSIVGLPDKAVAESRERVRGAFAGIGLALPPRRIIANLAPADLPKEGSHFDLPIALALLASLGVIAPPTAVPTPGKISVPMAAPAEAPAQAPPAVLRPAPTALTSPSRTPWITPKVASAVLKGASRRMPTDSSLVKASVKAPAGMSGRVAAGVAVLAAVKD